MVKFFEINSDGKIQFCDPPKIKTVRETLMAISETSLSRFYSVYYQDKKDKWIVLESNQDFSEIAKSKNFRIEAKNILSKQEYIVRIENLPLDSDIKNKATSKNFIILDQHIFLEDFIDRVKSSIKNETLSELLNHAYDEKLESLRRKEPFLFERAGERKKLRISKARETVRLIVNDIEPEEETTCCFSFLGK
jgi:hypothetical protein